MGDNDAIKLSAGTFIFTFLSMFLNEKLYVQRSSGDAQQQFKRALLSGITLSLERGTQCIIKPTTVALHNNGADLDCSPCFCRGNLDVQLRI